MKLMYVAVDGRMFETEKECKDYELTLVDIEMYDWYGNRTSDPNDAVLIYLEDEKDAETFIQLCKNADTSYCGITPDDSGWLMWNQFNDEYDLMPESILRLICKVGKDKNWK